ncbi:MAG: hypothetical protein HY905_08885 [Deltaproteobacteria bacterium]|nr:hypothetical protein [Deltaproteobacteria bacterium]
MKPFALLLLAVSVDAGPSCEKCNARDYKVLVALRNNSSWEILKARVDEALLDTPVVPGAQSATMENSYRSFEKPRLPCELALARTAESRDGRRIVIPAEVPEPDEVARDRLLVLEITDGSVRTKCTGMSRETYERITFPGIEFTPWDEVPCP